MPTDKTGVNALILERPEFSTGIRLVEVFDSEGKGMPLLPRTRFTLVAKGGKTVNVGGQKCLEIAFTSKDGKEVNAFMPRTLIREYGLNGFRLDFPFLPSLPAQELTGIAYGGDKLPYFTKTDPNEWNQGLATFGENGDHPYPEHVAHGKLVRRCRKCNGERSLHRVYETIEVKQKVLALHRLLSVMRSEVKPPEDLVKSIADAPMLAIAMIDPNAVQQFMDYRAWLIRKAPEAMLGVLMAQSGSTVKYIAAFSSGTTGVEDKFKLNVWNVAHANKLTNPLGFRIEENPLFKFVKDQFGSCFFRFACALVGLEAPTVPVKRKDELKALPQWKNNSPVGIVSVCAAVKLVQHCNDKKMVPLALSEIWFGTTQTTGTGYTDGETIESCVNCRKIIPFMLCPKTPSEFMMKVSRPDKPEPQLPLPPSSGSSNNNNSTQTTFDPFSMEQL